MSTDTQQMRAAFAAAVAMADAIHEVLVVAGDRGMPAGYIYLAFMQNNLSMDGFNTIMSALVQAGKARKEHDVYYAIPAKEKQA